MGAILALHLVSELHREFGRQLNVTYIDIKATFDSTLWKALQCIGVPPFLLRLMEDVHTGTTSRVRHGGLISEFLHNIWCPSKVA